jgi:hypothetical protein
MFFTIIVSISVATLLFSLLHKQDRQAEKTPPFVQCERCTRFVQLSKISRDDNGKKTNTCIPCHQHSFCSERKVLILPYPSMTLHQRKLNKLVFYIQKNEGIFSLRPNDSDQELEKFKRELFHYWTTDLKNVENRVYPTWMEKYIIWYSYLTQNERDILKGIQNRLKEKSPHLFKVKKL